MTGQSLGVRVLEYPEVSWHRGHKSGSQKAAGSLPPRSTANRKQAKSPGGKLALLPLSDLGSYRAPSPFCRCDPSIFPQRGDKEQRERGPGFRGGMLGDLDTASGPPGLTGSGLAKLQGHTGCNSAGHR